MRHVLLSPRQLQIAKLVAKGFTQAEIAEQLGISVRTVEHHCAAIRSKAQAPTTRRAVSRASARALGPRSAA